MAFKLKRHPDGDHIFFKSMTSNDKKTNAGVEHRVLDEAGDTDKLVDYLIPLMERHQISPDQLERRRERIMRLRIKGMDINGFLSPYPKNESTKKGNFAEMFLAEYLAETTDAQIPIYRLRFNPNPDQSMKGDDVLLFDLDSDPVRIIVGESKFRKVPSKKVVQEIVSGLVKSHLVKIPASLMFVADRLYEVGQNEYAKRISDCSILIVEEKAEIDYVGFFMSNRNTKSAVDKHTANELHNLLMITLNMDKPEDIVMKVFQRLEDQNDLTN